jgi:predicted TPR repeat methyltransferase
MNPLDIYSQVESHIGFNANVRELHKFYIDKIINSDCKSLLDIGCGQGYILEEINNHNSQIDTLGIDLSQSQVDESIKKGINTKCTSLSNLDKDTKYDCIIAVFDVLNFIPQDELQAFFEDVKIRLNDGGKFIFDVNSEFGFEEVAQGSLVVKDDDDEFINIDAIYEDDILHTFINSFTLQNDKYKRE